MKALYVAADVALIASVREGVNLWAMEYVACQGRDDAPPGVLVYSEFAGCASSFSGGALIVNPYDAEGVADALHNARSRRPVRCLRLVSIRRGRGWFICDAPRRRWP